MAETGGEARGGFGMDAWGLIDWLGGKGIIDL